MSLKINTHYHEKLLKFKLYTRPKTLGKGKLSKRNSKASTSRLSETQMEKQISALSFTALFLTYVSHFLHRILLRPGLKPTEAEWSLSAYFTLFCIKPLQSAADTECNQVRVLTGASLFDK